MLKNTVICVLLLFAGCSGSHENAQSAYVEEIKGRVQAIESLSATSYISQMKPDAIPGFYCQVLNGDIEDLHNGRTEFGAHLNYCSLPSLVDHVRDYGKFFETKFNHEEWFEFQGLLRRVGRFDKPLTLQEVRELIRLLKKAELG
jgi:hypothetical protein